MRLQKIHLLTGTALSLLVSAGIAHPVMANPAIEVAQSQNTSTSGNVDTIVGFVKSIVGEVVTIREEKAPYRTFRIERRVLGITGLVPGMKVRATVLRGTSQVQSLVVIPDVNVVATQATRTTTTTRTQTQTQTTPPPAPRPVPPRPAPVPRAQPQTTPPAPRPVPVQPAAPVRGLW